MDGHRTLQAHNFGGMDGPIIYKYIRFGTMGWPKTFISLCRLKQWMASKPCKFITFGAMICPKTLWIYRVWSPGWPPQPYKFIKFGTTHGPKSYIMYKLWSHGWLTNIINL